MMDLFGLAAVGLRCLDAENAHRATIAALKLMPPCAPAPDDPRLAVSAFGLSFPNPVGLAAGFDKDAEVADVEQVGEHYSPGAVCPATPASAGLSHPIR